MDAQGNAVAVWQQNNDIYASRFTPSSGWGTAQLIETNSGNASEPKVAMDPQGSAVAVWDQWDGDRFNVWSNRFTPAGGWGTAELIETNDVGNGLDPEVAVDPQGNAVVVWIQWETTFDVWSNRFTPAGGWGTAERIEADGGRAEQPRVAVDALGNAVAAWWQSDGTRNNVWSNRFTPSGGWGAAQLIENNDDAPGAFNPRIAADPQGNAVVVWEQWADTHADVWSNHFTPVAGWSTAQLIENDDAGDAKDPDVAMDDQGNATAVWSQSDGVRDNIWSNQFR
jgi:hypothetical protein